MSSPIIVTLMGEPSGKLKGKAALAGTDSVTVYYKGHRGLSAEVLLFGVGGKVRAAFAHYVEWSA